MLTVTFSQQRFPHPFLSSCIAVGKLTIDLIVITCDQDVFLLWVLLWSSLFFLFCGFTLAGIGGDIFSFHLSMCFLSVVTSHEFKKETNKLLLLYIFSVISFKSTSFEPHSLFCFSLLSYFLFPCLCEIVGNFFGSIFQFAAFFFNSISNLLFNPFIIFSFNIFPF